jgi:Cu-Zn family superoxide dismutase
VFKSTYRLLALVIVMGGALLIGSRATTTQAVDMRGYAQINDSTGRPIGLATFVENAAGDLTVTVEASGLAPGKHGLHVHAVGSCVGPDFITAGGHFNPLSRRHGLQTSDGAHGGDLPNLVVGADGRGRFSMTIASMRLSPGVLSLLDPDGSAIVIHAAEDDGMTDATGNSGARVACGIVTVGNAPAMTTVLPAPRIGAPNTGDAGLVTARRD